VRRPRARPPDVARAVRRHRGFHWRPPRRAVQGEQPRHDPLGRATAGEVDLHLQRAIRAGIDRGPIDALHRPGFQPHRPIDPAEDPEIRRAFRFLNARIRRVLADEHCKLIFCAKAELVG